VNRNTQPGGTEEASASFLAAIVESSEDAIISKNLDGIVTSWNKAAEHIFGYRAAEMIGQPISKIIPAEIADEEQSILARLRRGERIEHYETVRCRKDGSRVDISLTISPVKNRHGVIVGASKIARDITEQRRTQERLRQSEERFRVTLASVGDAVIATDKEGRVTFMNSVAEKLTGWNEQEALGIPLSTAFNIVNEINRRPVENPVFRVLQEGVVVGLANHTTLISRHGKEWPIDDSAAPIRGTNGELAGVVLVFRESTRQRAAELTLRKLAAIVENSEDAIFSTDLNGVITSWNPAAENLFGYSAPEALGKTNVSLIVPEDRRQEELEVVERLKKGENVGHYETTRITRNGQRIDVSLSVALVKDPSSGRVIGVSKILRDITPRKRADLAARLLLLVSEELSRASNPLEMMQRTAGEIGKFFNAAHCSFVEFDPATKNATVHFDWRGEEADLDLAGVYQLAEYLTEDSHRTLTAGLPLVVHDVITDPRTAGSVDNYRVLRIGSYLLAPFVSDGNLKFALAIHRRETHAWRDAEIALLRELTARVWTRIERSRAEEALRESEGRLRRVLDGAPTAMVVRASDGEILLVNRAWTEVTGYTREDIPTVDHWLRLAYRDESEHVAAILREELAGDSVIQNREFQIWTKSNERRIVQISSGAVGQLPDGRTLRAINAIDVTDRKRIEKALAANATQFQLVVEAAPNGMVMVDERGLITMVNAQMERLFGYERAEMVGQPIEMLLPARYRPAHPAQRQEFFRSPLTRAMGHGRDLFARRKDGSEFPVEVGLNPAETPDGRVVLAAVIDITERKRTQYDLEKSAAQLRLVVEAAPNGMVMVNERGQILMVNAQMERLFGYARAEMVGQSIEMLLPERYQAAHPGQRQDFFRSPLTRAMGHGRDLFARRKDGSEFPVEVGLNPAATPDGTVVLAAVIDISQRKRMEADLAKAHAQLSSHARNLEATVAERTASLQATIAELEGVSYSLSHDMRAPLRTIQSFSQIVLAEAGDKLGPMERDLLDKTISAASRLDRLIQDVLIYSRVARESIQLTTVDVERLLRQIIHERPDFQPPKAQIEIQLPLLSVCGHEAYLTQCITNLLDNAVKFVAPGTQPRIRIWSEPRNNQVRLWFEDNGIGIPEEAQQRVFGMFERIHAETIYPGTGIGLTIVRKAVERMGGTAGVESEPGRGSRFWLQLPRTEPGKTETGTIETGK
jgi:PAS domain S-box-containing protein